MQKKKRSTKARSRVQKKSTVARKRSDRSGLYIGLFLFTAVIMFISLYTDGNAIVMGFFKSGLYSLFGMGAYIFPFLIIALVLMYLFDKEKFRKNTAAVIVLYISILSILGVKVTSGSGAGFSESMSETVAIAQTGFGGGIVGGFFNFLLLNLFGKVGAIITSIFAIVVAVVVISEADMVELTRSVFLFLRKIPAMALWVKNGIVELFTEYRPVIEIEKDDLKINKSGRRESRSSGKSKRKSAARKTDAKSKRSPVVDRVKAMLEREKRHGLSSEPEAPAEPVVMDEFVFEMASGEEAGSPSQEEMEMEFEIKREERPDTEAESQKSLEAEVARFSSQESQYQFPPIGFLSGEVDTETDDEDLVRANAKKLKETLANFGIEATVGSVNIGPSITKYEIQIAPGIKVSRILNLSNDLALSLASSDIRIEAPIPGKSAIGIEIPNKHRASVNLREIIESKAFGEFKGTTPIALGKDVEGNPVIADIEKMPHMLIAGATGSGKSVCINTIITSIIYKSSPEDVRLILIDPKVVELSVYNGIPHLLIPVVTDPKKAAGALNWAVVEMNKRYEMFASSGVRDIKGYNKKAEQKLPKIVMIIDELSDLMMAAASSEVEDLICRIAQMARAAGIHLILATQRPSVDVITGTIKANIPSRISFAVSSQTDSRTILDMGGAEKLLGRGDMLFYPSGMSKPQRIQGAFIDDEEVEKIVEFLKSRRSAGYEENVIEEIEKRVEFSESDCDELLSQAIDMVIETGQASTSFLQRRLKIGYSRAARIVDQMQDRGIVSPPEGNKSRRVLVKKEDLQ